MPSQASSDATTVANIEEVLNKLWAHVEQTEGQDAVTRTTTLNLIFYVDDTKEVSNLIDSITEGYPCRAIVIEVGGDQTDTLNATATIYCHLAIGGAPRSQVCCEEIRLTAGRDAVERIPSAVEALLLPDHPVYLYHEGDFSLIDPILMQLGEVVDGVIVDSAMFNDAPAGMQALLSVLHNTNFKGWIADLNWGRLLHWREAVAHSAGGSHDMLVATREVEILHRGARAEGLLILGWLASRLKWQIVPDGNDPNTWTAKSPEGEITLRLKVVVSGVMGLQKLSVKTQSHSYEIQLSEDLQCLITKNGQVTTTPIQPPDTLANLIGRAIDAQDRDRVFEQALIAAVSLATQGHMISQRAGVIVANNADDLARLAARNFIQTARHCIARQGRFTVALSGGSTPKLVFDLLAQAPYRDEVEWAKAHVFWGDERNVPIDHADSNQRMARETFLSKVPIPPGNIHKILTGRLTAEDAADRYNAEIMAFFKLEAGNMPEFDLVLLGMGEDGHTASLFPGSPALAAPVDKIFVANPVAKLQTTRLTLTANAINNAANVVFWISGAAKADILCAVLEGPLKPDELPSQRIQPAGGSLTILADQAAAAKIRLTQRLT